MSLDPVFNVITVQTNDDSHVGTHLIDAKVSLVNYPSIYSEVQFTVEIIHCIVTDMAQVPVAD